MGWQQQRSEMILVAAALALCSHLVGLTSAKEWAVHIDGDVDDLVAAHSLVNLGEVLPGSKIYHLALSGEGHSRAKRDLIHSSLEGHSAVKWVEKQDVLSRAKRMPVECYISTLPTENKIARYDVTLI